MEIYWDQFETDDAETHPFGDDTARIIDENLGGVIAYCHRDTAERIVTALRRLEASSF